MQVFLIPVIKAIKNGDGALGTHAFVYSHVNLHSSAGSIVCSRLTGHEKLLMHP